MALSVSRLVNAILAGWRNDPESKFAPGSSLAPSSGTPATNIEATAYYEAKAIVEEVQNHLGPVVGGGDHATLDAATLAWTASGHTGLANRIAGFTGAGAAGQVVAGDGLTLSSGTLAVAGDVLRDTDIGASVAAQSHNHDADYAPIAKGVTNGDSHDHNGGDGAQIAHGNLSGIGTNSHATIDSHLANTSNPHSVTKTQVGLGNVTDDAQLKRAAGDFASFTAKSAPVGADLLLIEDSAATGAKKRATLLDLLFPGGSMFVPNGGRFSGDGTMEVLANNKLTLKSEGDLDIVSADPMTVDAPGVDFTGSITLGTPLAIADGGTGASDGATALTNLGIIRARPSADKALAGGFNTGTVILTLTLAAGVQYDLTGFVRYAVPGGHGLQLYYTTTGTVTFYTHRRANNNDAPFDINDSVGSVVGQAAAATARWDPIQGSADGGASGGTLVMRANCNDGTTNGTVYQLGTQLVATPVN